jgi:hypothetical protein
MKLTPFLLRRLLTLIYHLTHYWFGGSEIEQHSTYSCIGMICENGNEANRKGFGFSLILLNFHIEKVFQLQTGNVFDKRLLTSDNHRNDVTRTSISVRHMTCWTKFCQSQAEHECSNEYYLNNYRKAIENSCSVLAFTFFALPLCLSIKLLVKLHAALTKRCEWWSAQS